jgi:CMP-N,N'-diacetyllegionaminic acid synthase
MPVVALIPARGGSKGIPGKNLAVVAGRPLIAYTIEAAQSAGCCDRIIVSTDDQDIAQAAREFGAEVPFMRPADLAGDASPMLGVLCHALDWCEQSGEHIDAMVLLQPTSPLRSARHIREAVALFFQHHATSVVSVMEVPHQFNPVSVLSIEDGVLQPYLKDGPRVTRRQDKPKVYARNGPAVLVCDPAMLRFRELYGPTCVPYLMSAVDSLDIDERDDLDLAEWLIERRRHDR